MAADKNPWSDLQDSLESDSESDSEAEEFDSDESINLFKESILTSQPESKKSIKKERSSVSQIKKDHLIHTYVRHERRKDIFRCAHKYCYHMTDKTLLLGKANICRCGTEFILTREDLRRKWPRCPLCSNVKNRDLIDKAKNASRKVFEALEKSAELKQIALSDLTVRREED